MIQTIKNSFFSKTRIILFSIVSLSFTACSNNSFYDKYYQIDQAIWNKDSIISFDFHSSDTLSRNEIYLKIRNTIDFPYSNLYLFTKVYFPDGNIVVDTLEYEMADPMGNWLGEGLGGLKNNLLYFKKNVVFYEIGDYKITVQHGMRQVDLPGIQDVGLLIENNNTK